MAEETGYQTFPGEAEGNEVSCGKAPDLTPEQKAALLKSAERAKARHEAGGSIPGEDVFAWMRSWGSTNELPQPQPKPRNR